MKQVLLKSGLSYADADALNAAVEAIFSASEKATALGPGSKVLLKPNLLAKHTPEKAVTTHPAVVAAVADALHRRGVTDITLADSSGGIYTENTMRAIYKASGLAGVCEAKQLHLWGQTTSGRKAANGVRCKEFNLLTPVLESDFIIDLPKIKTHVMTGMTCAVKNLFGCVPGLQKAEFHMRFPDREQFGEMLVDLCETVAPALTIADGIVALEGDGPAGGSPKVLGILLGSEDPYLLDLAAAKLIGIAPQKVPYLAAAMRRGLCAQSFSDEALAPNSDPLMPVSDFVLPSSYADITFGDQVPTGLRWATPMVTRFAAPHPVVRRAKCIGCGKCAEICPGRTIELKDKKAKIKKSGCIRCFCCHEMCPVKAIDVKSLPFFKL